MSFGRKLGAKRESGRKIVKERTFLSKGRAYIFVSNSIQIQFGRKQTRVEQEL